MSLFQCTEYYGSLFTTDMGILDFDDNEILRKSGITKRRAKHHDHASESEDNFEVLQNLGHAPNSEDFADSPFADRR